MDKELFISVLEVEEKWVPLNCHNATNERFG